MPRAHVRWSLVVPAVVLCVALALVLVVVLVPRWTPVRTAVTWAWEARYRLFPIDDRAELVVLHRDATLSSREQCVACHGDRTGSALIVHRIHLQSDLLRNIVCSDCHRRVELVSKGGAAGATWVDVGFCKKCHSAFPTLPPGSNEHAGGIESDCAGCHTGDRAPRHAQPYLPRKIPASECKGCHGARVLPWTPRHEQAGWLAVHGTEALATGVERCFECHDFGLKFCDECHSKKPASHMPAEQWRIRHPAAARADTRVCYTCHETGFCKNCHVNHEQGWMQTHPAFVKKRGSASCTECHSASACSYCHTAVLQGLDAPSITP